MVKRLSTVDQNNNPITNVPTPSAGTDAANKAYVDSLLAGAGGSTVHLNTIYAAQKNLTGSGVPALTGNVDGANTSFTVPEAIYVTGTIQVFVNGVLQHLGDSIVETTPASGVFTFVEAPKTGDQVFVTYQKFATASAGFVTGVVAGANITVNNSNPSQPIISATGGGGTPTSISGDSGIVDVNVAANFGSDTILLRPDTTSASNTLYLVTPENLYISSNAGIDGTGPWDNTIELGDTTGGVGVTAGSPGSSLSLTADNGIYLRSAGASMPAKIGTTNLTAERSIDFPDKDGTLIVSEDPNVINLHSSTIGLTATSSVSIAASSGIALTTETGALALGAGGGVQIGSNLHVDNVIEKTPDAGVTIDGVVLKDGKIVLGASHIGVGFVGGIYIAGVTLKDGLVDGKNLAQMPNITSGTTAPSAPAVGDLWVDMN